MIGSDQVPHRMLREGILTSERVNQLDRPAEVFYRRVMSVVDDFGRYYAKPELLRAACYPLLLDKVTNSDVDGWIAECRSAALMRTYTVDGKEYLELADFRQQVRAKKSKFPDPPGSADPLQCECKADDKQNPATAHLDVDVNGDVGGAVGRKRAPTKTTLPDDFSLSDRVRTWAVSRGVFNLDAHFEAFVSRARAKAYTYASWDDAFMGAVRDDWAKLGKGAPEGQKRVPI